MNETSLSNDLLKLVPKTSIRDPKLTFEFSGLKIGVATYEEGPTGCTTFHFDKKAKMVNDFRGGSGPFLINSHLNVIDAICFTGGSLYGFEAITGITSELLKMQNYKSEWFTIPLVAGAICYDLGWRKNVIYPDKLLARAAIRTERQGIFPLGNQGAGRATTVGKLNYPLLEPGGQGGSFIKIGDTKILFFTVTNSLGALIDKNGFVVRGNYDRTKDRRFLSKDIIKHYEVHSYNANTTLNLLVTNQKFSVYELNQIARQVHSSLSKAIDPIHTVDDGDVLFAVTTDEIDNRSLPSSAFGIEASELAWDAILKSFEPDMTMEKLEQII